ncbi:MAG TPA: hypothetical protein VI387_08965, partial [Candidatus Brocadiales bacterium]|nr:hypothetical protein [Candidatus Brocadiales bacterium]
MRKSRLVTVLITIALECGMWNAECGIPQSAHPKDGGSSTISDSQSDETLSINAEPTDYGVVLYTVRVSRATVSEFLKTLSNACSVKLTIDDDVDTSILSSYVTVYLEKA